MFSTFYWNKSLLYLKWLYGKSSVSGSFLSVQCKEIWTNYMTQQYRSRVIKYWYTMNALCWVWIIGKHISHWFESLSWKTTVNTDLWDLYLPNLFPSLVFNNAQVPQWRRCCGYNGEWCRMVKNSSSQRFVKEKRKTVVTWLKFQKSTILCDHSTMPAWGFVRFER